ncbi:MAG: phenylalanine--tRNA ligase subunit beta [Pirellulaceae bacterium]
MLVCWEWLSQYVELSVAADAMAHKFAMSGLNHESTEQVGSDTVIDLEVTSNRGDCLGHIGVAREAAVLLGKKLCTPDPQPPSGGPPAASLITLENQFEAACPRYTARIIRGVRIGPSPEWLVRRLAAIGIKSVNNVVDVTNYVMMECGQPLHAFDLAHIRDAKIIVRPATANEKFIAIDHRTYELDAQMVVIADGQRAVALGGVMGGSDSEVSDTTQDLLIEAASFAPLPIRRTARKLKLHSPSSFRFERRPDPTGLDWASLRCCDLILQVAGGELCEGVVAVGSAAAPRTAIPFRFSQVPRILGIDVPTDESSRILQALGCEITDGNDRAISVTPPTWRSDLTREIDLIEEVARIYGYERIPEDVTVPLGVAAPRPKDIALGRVRHVLSAYGIDEAMTPSVVTEALENCGSVWSDAQPLSTETPLLVGSRLLRRSLLPSLLAARHNNQTQSIRNAQLYEVANIYLPPQTTLQLPREQCTLGVVTSSDLRFIKGTMEEMLQQVVDGASDIHWEVVDHDFFQSGTSQRIWLGEKLIGWIGIVSPKITNALSLDQPCAAAEIDIDVLTAHLLEVRRADAVSLFPAVTRDLNFVVDESLAWGNLASTIRAHGGEFLQTLSYQETYRDAKKDGADKKRILLTLHFQSLTRTLTGDEVDANVGRIIAACETQFAARLLA